MVETSGKNIVFVGFNYRVGLWGFLASERVRKDGDLNVGRKLEQGTTVETKADEL